MDVIKKWFPLTWFKKYFYVFPRSFSFPHSLFVGIKSFFILYFFVWSVKPKNLLNPILNPIAICFA